MRLAKITMLGTLAAAMAACAGDVPGDMDTGAGSSAGETGDGSGGSGTQGEGDGETGGIKYDVDNGMDFGTSDDGGDGPCNCGNDEWSYVWIANTAEHTVSKIDTRSLEEHGRYLTRPDGGGSPSRTSVSIDGRAMAVANRHGGLTKIWATESYCSGNNTSTGADDVKAWGEDDCVAWHVPFEELTVQRPVQFTPGLINEQTCEYYDQKIWTVGGNGGSAGTCGTGGTHVFLLDAEDGSIEESDVLGDVPCAANSLYNNLGPYGAAADLDGNLYFHTFSTNTLVRVDLESFTHEKFTMPHTGYGIFVDNGGKVWINRAQNVGKISRFDYETKTFETADVGGKGGIAQDLEGRIWTANGPDGIAAIDRETMEVGPLVPIPGNNPVKGLSVDIDGWIWAVRNKQDIAYKVDPETYELEGFQGLNKPYTYSDMTGGAIANNTCNPVPEG